MEIVKKYMNVDRLASDILNIYKDSRDGFINDENREFLMGEYPDDYLEDIAYERAWECNADMKRYLNSKDHKIEGNFNNVDYDYPLHVYGVVEYNKSMVSAMVERLNNGETSEQADADRDWLVDWFWETFGTFGMTYNFDTEIGERLYEFENE